MKKVEILLRIDGEDLGWRTIYSESEIDPMIDDLLDMIKQYAMEG